MKVKEIDMLEPLSAEEDQTVFEVAKLLSEKKIRQITIVQGGKPVGILAAVDIVSKIVVEEKDPKEVKAKDIMTTPVFCCNADDDLVKSYMEMANKNILSCPVIENDRFVGTAIVQNMMIAITKKQAEEKKE